MMKIQNFLFSLFLLLFISQCGDFNVHQGLIVFVTSTTYTGGFTAASGTGLAGGDFLCNQAAANGGLSGTFRVWLSTSTVNASTRVSNRKYVRNTDYAVVAENRTDLTDGTLVNAINRDEFGTAYTDTTNHVAWTGTKSDGTVATNTCTNWTTSSGPTTGQTGVIPSAASTWTEVTTLGGDAVSCTQSRRLYCFQID